MTQMYNAFNYTYPEQMHQYGKVRPLTDYAREITMSELASEENEDTKMCNDTTNGRKK
jgi:hypothetical protein